MCASERGLCYGVSPTILVSKAWFSQLAARRLDASQDTCSVACLASCSATALFFHANFHANAWTCNWLCRQGGVVLIYRQKHRGFGDTQLLAVPTYLSCAVTSRLASRRQYLSVARCVPRLSRTAQTPAAHLSTQHLNIA